MACAAAHSNADCLRPLFSPHGRVGIESCVRAAKMFRSQFNLAKMTTPNSGITALGPALDKPVVDCKTNYETLLSAIGAGNVGLVEVTLKATGEKCAAICAITKTTKNGVAGFNIVPFALMMNGNPYELLEPPTEGEKDEQRN